MFAILAALGFVGGLVALAIKDTTEPAIKPAWEINKLKELKARGRWNIDQAEDTLALARRYGDKEAEKKFVKIVSELRKRRGKV